MRLESINKESLVGKIRATLLEDPQRVAPIPAILVAEHPELTALDRANWTLADLENWPKDLQELGKEIEEALGKRYRLALAPWGSSAHPGQ